MGNKINNSKTIDFPHENKNIKKEYFYFLSKNFVNHSYNINNYQLNTIISFEKNFQNKNNSKNKLRTNINWKNYLINFFKKQEKKGHEFYADIIKDFQKEKFGFENKYLSFMFYLDFDNTYHSKNIEKNFKKYIKEDILDLENELKTRFISRNSSLDMSTNVLKKSKSIIDISNLFDKEKEMKNISFEKNKINREMICLVKLIKSQIEKEDHPINIIISIFEKQISSLIDNLLESYYNEEEKEEFLKNIENLNNTITNNIQKFASKIYIATKLFYSRVIHLDCFIEEKDELINIIMGIIFNKGSLENKIKLLFSLQYKGEISIFSNNLKCIRNLKPKDIQIDDKFCLDENTDKLINKLRKEYNEEDQNINKDEKDEKIFSNVLKTNKRKLYSKSKNKYDGYNSAINILKNEVPKEKSPYKKMQLIASISTEITECVDKYWEDEEEIIPSWEFLQVTSDELLKIFIFIVVHSELDELIIHEMIVQRFTFSLTKLSMIGFYNSTLDAAINYIQNNLLDEVKNGITENFRNSIIGKVKISSTLNKNNNISFTQNNKLYDDSTDEEFFLTDGLNELKKDKLYNNYATFNNKKQKGEYKLLELFKEE